MVEYGGEIDCRPLLELPPPPPPLPPPGPGPLVTNPFKLSA